MRQTNTKETPAGPGPGAAPTISLPKGGGAISGIGEKFAANPVTGTGAMTVPIATSPGRSAFGPQLSLSYDSGTGNGPFGFGWSLSLPSITRKTDKGLPRYRDPQESDVFILSRTEDLVPALEDLGGGWKPKHVQNRIIDGTTYGIRQYRPRIEGLFARIERWTNQADSADTFWRSISKDNITTWYGKTPESRIVDSADPFRVFSWLICESYDDKGNVTVFGYKEENSDGAVLSKVHERNRTDDTRKVNRYLKRIRYGNRTPHLPKLVPTEPWPAPPGATGADGAEHWFFETVLDYGEHDAEAPEPNDKGTWNLRNDPFSSYRAGFEVRTYRLCQRVLMFHHFPGEPGVGADCLVRSTDFTYSYEDNEPDPRDPIFSFLISATHSGYARQANSYLKRSVPPLEFEYTQPIVHEEIHNVDPDSLENLPYGLDNGRYQWVDLDGEGLSGVLTEQAEGWFYKRNLSPLSGVGEGGKGTVVARFGPLERLAQQPSLAAIGSGRQQFLDLAGDGQLDLVEFEGSTAGFYERTPDEGWEPFARFSSLPVLDWGDPNLKFMDLTGDGHADILISEDDVFCWHPSLAEAGFGPQERVGKALDEEKGPRVVFADGSQAIYLADLSGDGLTDLVRIRNGEVCYWPNLGYGRFGAKVTMDNGPWFDAPDLFDQRRIRLADIDGSGVTDIIYLGGAGPQLYFNQSGNGWSEARLLTAFPAVDRLSSVQVADLLGNGTACLVWSSPLPGDARRPMSYLDLMGGHKPHLLVKAVNNLGAETHVEYAPSTKFYVADKLAGRPWISKLPFPVHVVERVETYDRISGNRFVTRSAYHHGYFDGAEREFRGFGMVEQWDTEEIGTVADDAESSVATNLDEASFLPPVLTRTWFHTGAYMDGSRISLHFEDEYYHEGDASLGAGLAEELTAEQRRAMLLDDSVMSGEMTADAYRALKGSILRQEVYARDGTEEEDRPYTVSERSYTVVCLQPRSENRHAVFFTHPREAIELHYERKLFPVEQHLRADPRVTHALTFEVDPYGNVLRSAAVAYGRRHDDPDPLLTTADRLKQKRTMLTFTENHYTEPVLEDHAYRAPLPCETRTYEVINVESFPDLASSVAGVTNLFRFDSLHKALDEASDGDHEIDYEDADAAGAVEGHPYRRLIEHARTLYRADLLTGPLELGTLGTLGTRALPYETLTLAFTPGLLAGVYRRNGENLLPDADTVLREAGYVAGDDYRASGLFPADDLDGRWWVPSGQISYSPDASDTPSQELGNALEHFFLPRRFRDPFGNVTAVDYDVHDLLPVETHDGLENTVRAANDYRVLQPRRITDPNGNRAEAAYDVVGLVAGTAIMGKETESLGDSLAGFATDLDLTTIRAFAADPRGVAAGLLGDATTRFVYNLDRFARCGQPPFASSIARETHASDPLPPDGLKIQIAVGYSDGFGRELQTKIQAESGDAPEREPDFVLPSGDRVPGALVLENGKPHPAPTMQRWVGSGRTIYNNKGKPVKQYEPFFSATHLYEEEPDMAMTGVTPILCYDPVERVVATLHPNHTFEKVVFDPWRQETWDANDTVLIADAAGDEHVGGVFARLPQPDYLPTWHQQRAGGVLGSAEQQAAQKAAAHAGTPSVEHFDTLGRAFLTVADNGGGGKYPTRVEYDIEGNQRVVIDARDNAVMRCDYDVRGTRIHQVSTDAGTRWMLGDVVGKPVRAWDSRGFTRRITYDELRRPVETRLSEGSGAERLVERIVYGESEGAALNHRGRVIQHFDGAGAVTNVAYDFKGNLLQCRRQLAADYTSIPDWSGTVAMEEPPFDSSTSYDALNRPAAMTAPDGSVIRPAFNDASLLESVGANLHGDDAVTTFVENVDYNAKGQRELIVYGSGVRTTYGYDPLTFRLVHLETLRGVERLQDLSYSYDAIGNITRIEDVAQPTVFHDNLQVEAHADYVYDAIYRLIEAAGREHDGSGSPDPPENFPQWKPHHDFNDWTRRNKTHPNDKNALRPYVERYEYDEVGNIRSVSHQPFGGINWTREHQYSPENNRLLGTSLPGDPVGTCSAKYAYDAHGNMIAMPHLAVMAWDFKDQLQMTQRQAVSAGIGERTYYTYDAAGQRARKVTERQNGTRKDERIYLGGFEIYREYGGGSGSVTLKRETLHLMDDRQRIALVETKTLDVSSPSSTPQSLARYQLGNHLGSSMLELDTDGEIISYEEYFPYGGAAYQAGRSLAEVSLKRYRYTEKERDEETGLYYHGARYYGPWLGRWTSCDPAGAIDGTNLYRYSRNNPIVLVDRDGRDPAPPGAGRLSAEELNSTYSLSPENQAYANKVASGRYDPKVRDLPSSSAKLETASGRGDTSYRVRFAQQEKVMDEAAYGMNQYLGTIPDQAKVDVVGPEISSDPDDAPEAIGAGKVALDVASEERIRAVLTAQTGVDFRATDRIKGAVTSPIYVPPERGASVRFPVGEGRPVGFRGEAHFRDFASEAHAEFEAHGLSPDILVGGSAATGIKYETGQPFRPGTDPKLARKFPRLANRGSDYDLAIVSPELLEAAKSAGIRLRNRQRTGALENRELREIGLLEVQRKLSATAGRKVSLMIYGSPAAVQRQPTIRINRPARR